MEYLTDHDYSLAHANGISHQQAYDRFYRLGWPKHRTVTEPPLNANLWGQFKERCEANGIKKMTFYQRMYSYGMSAMEASTTPLLERGGNFAKQRKVLPQDLIDIAASNGISKSTLMYRIRRAQWDVERAVTEPVHRKFWTEQRKAAMLESANESSLRSSSPSAGSRMESAEV